MDYALQPHLYKNVPVYLWPWVWWQLFQIERWIKETGRMVLGGVARDGKVYVLHVADDPNVTRNRGRPASQNSCPLGTAFPANAGTSHGWCQA